MTNRYRVREIFRRTTLFTGIFVANMAMAEIEEIVVTAQKRSESVQEVPISMTALSEADIQNKGITDLKDLWSAVSGVSGFEAPSSRGNISMSLRGIGSGNANSVSIDPANAIYVDGVYLGKAAGNGVDAMDLERIEVLKGPQGTLYGRNSTGGAINFITKKPQDEFAAKLKLSAGNYGSQELNGRVDLPLGEQLSVALSGYSRQRDPLYENTRPGGQGFENIDRSGFRVAAQWRPSEDFTVDYSYAENELDEQIQALDVIGFNPLAAGVLAADGYPANVSIASRDRINQIAGLKGFLPFLGAAAAAPEVQQLDAWMGDYLAYANAQLDADGTRPERGSSDTNSQSTNQVDAHNLTLSWDVQDMGAFGDVQFKSITGQRKVKNLQQGDLDGMDNTVASGVIGELQLLTIGGLFFNSISPFLDGATEFATGQALVNAILTRGDAPIYNNYATIDHKQFSEELQMIGSTDRLEYVVGLYYYDDESQFRNNRTATFPLAFTATSSHDLTSKAKSVNAQMTWTPSDDSKLALTAGVQYTKETKTIEYLWRSSENAFGFFGPFFAGQSPAVTYVANELAETQAEVAGVYGKQFSNDFSDTSGRLSAQYFFTDKANAFLTYSTGYRSGGFNGDFYNKVNDAAGAFDKEKITSVEAGMKSQLLDDRLVLNATIYNYEYRNVQVSTLLPQSNGTVTSSIVNAGKANRGGLEMSVIYAPVDALVLGLDFNYISGDFDQYPSVYGSSADGAAELKMDSLAKRGMSPANQLGVSVDWTIMSSARSSVHLYLNGNWQQQTNPIAANTASYDTNANKLPDSPVVFQQLDNDQRTLLNGRLVWDLAINDNNLAVALWGRNLLDDNYRSFSFNYGDALGLSVAQYGEPRTVGVDFIWEM